MRVLVWQSYGSIKVFLADTPMQFYKIYMSLAPGFDVMGVSSNDVQSLKAKMGNATSSETCERLFSKFFRDQHLVGEHETFERLEFVEVEDVKTS